MVPPAGIVQLIPKEPDLQSGLATLRGYDGIILQTCAIDYLCHPTVDPDCHTAIPPGRLIFPAGLPVAAGIS